MTLRKHNTLFIAILCTFLSFSAQSATYTYEGTDNPDILRFQEAIDNHAIGDMEMFNQLVELKSIASTHKNEPQLYVELARFKIKCHYYYEFGECSEKGPINLMWRDVLETLTKANLIEENYFNAAVLYLHVMTQIDNLESNQTQRLGWNAYNFLKDKYREHDVTNKWYYYNIADFVVKYHENSHRRPFEVGKPKEWETDLLELADYALNQEYIPQDTKYDIYSFLSNTDYSQDRWLNITALNRIIEHNLWHTEQQLSWAFGDLARYHSYNGQWEMAKTYITQALEVQPYRRAMIYSNLFDIALLEQGKINNSEADSAHAIFSARPDLIDQYISDYLATSKTRSLFFGLKNQLGYLPSTVETNFPKNPHIWQLAVLKAYRYGDYTIFKMLMDLGFDPYEEFLAYYPRRPGSSLLSVAINVNIESMTNYLVNTLNIDPNTVNPQAVHSEFQKTLAELTAEAEMPRSAH